MPTVPFELLAGAPLAELVLRAERGEPLPRGPSGPGVRTRLRVGKADAVRLNGVAVAEAGDLAHVYFLDDRGRCRSGRCAGGTGASSPRSRRAGRSGSWPCAAAAGGFALVRGEALDLADAADVARLPHPDPALLATYLADLVSLPDSGDLVVLGWRGEGRDIVAYAWEFGSHGGVAPEELECFVAHPAHRPFPCAEALRPSALNAWFEGIRRGEAEGGERDRERSDAGPGAPAP